MEVFSTGMTQEDEVRAIELLVERLRLRFPSATPEHLEQVLVEVHHQYDGRPIRDFIPVLVEREVTERMRDAEFA